MFNPVISLARGNLCRSLCRNKDLHCVKFIRISTVHSNGPDENPSTSLQQPSGSLSVDSVLENAAPQSIETSYNYVDMASYGFNGWLPTDWTPFLCEIVYNTAQLPWWGTIASVACLVRLSLLPWALKYRIALGRVALAAKECAPARYRMNAAKNKGDALGAAKEAAEVFRIYNKHNITFYTPFKFPVAKTAMLVAVLWGIKGMIAKSVVGLDVGGALWFPNLLQADPYGVLPVMTGLGLLTNIQLEWEEGEDDEFQQKVRRYLSVGSIVAIPILWTFPSGLLLYVISNSIFSTGQILLFKYPPVQQYFKFPDKMVDRKQKK